MLFALDIRVNKTAPQTHSVHCGLNPPFRNITPSFFAKPPLKSSNYPIPVFQTIHPQYIGFSCTPSKNRIFQ